MGEDRMVEVTQRLYDTDEHGIPYLAYAVGAQAPADEVARLSGGKAAPVKEPTVKELVAIAAELGIETKGVKKADLVEMIAARRLELAGDAGEDASAPAHTFGTVGATPDDD